MVNSFFAVIEFLGFTLTPSKYFIQYKVPGGTIDLSVKVTQIQYKRDFIPDHGIIIQVNEKSFDLKEGI